MNFGADLPVYYADFGKLVEHRPVAGQVSEPKRAILDEPGTAILGDQLLATDYSLRFPAVTFQSVRRGDQFIIDSNTFVVREDAQPVGVDGLECIVPLAKVAE